VADLDLQKGGLSDRLGLTAEGSWIQSDRITADGLAPKLLLHSSRLSVLPSPRIKAREVASAPVAKVLEFLRSWYDFVVLDTPANLGTQASAVLSSSSLILLLLTPEPAILRQAQASLPMIRQIVRAETQIWPIVNMAQSRQEPFAKQVEQVLVLPVAAVLPWAPQECEQAVQTRNPVVLSAPGSALSAAIQELARDIRQAAQLVAQERNGT
jgi:pilus assembly protein CpaE